MDVLRAAAAIINCRTEHLGSHLESFDCGHVSRIAHIIFTVPEQLNVRWQFNRALFVDKLMTAARQSLKQLMADPKYLGAKPGIISALHTWGRNLSVHSHVHCLVSAGGIDSDGQFVKSERSFVHFVPFVVK